MTALVASDMRLRVGGYTKTGVIRCRVDSSSKTLRTVHVRETWLWQNQSAMELVRQGLAEMERGETVDLGSFAEYADIDIDE